MDEYMVEDDYWVDDWDFGFSSEDSYAYDPMLDVQEDYSNVIGTDTSFGENIINLTSEMGTDVLGDTSFGEKVVAASAVDNSNIFDSVFGVVTKAVTPVATTAVQSTVSSGINKLVTSLFGGSQPQTVKPKVAPSGYRYDAQGRLVNAITGQVVSQSSMLPSFLSGNIFGIPTWLLAGGLGVYGLKRAKVF